MEINVYQPKLLLMLVTKADLYALEEKMDLLTSLLGKIDTNFEDQIKKILDYISFDALTQDFLKLNLKLNNQADLENYLNLVKQEMQNIKYLKLTLAITPTRELVEEIYFWAAKNIGTQTLIDLTTDASLIAGGLIEYEGKYKDYSMKSKLGNYFNANPN